MTVLVKNVQNPAPAFPSRGQEFESSVAQRTEQLLQDFLRVLPSNYVSQVKGPFYTLQFQAALEVLARLQLEAELFSEDLDYRFTRTEYLFQILGELFFADPLDFDSDLDLREFYRRLILILLQGSTKESLRQATALLTVANIVVRESGPFVTDIEISFATRTSVEEDHYHSLEINAEGSGQTLKMFDPQGVEITTDHTHSIVDHTIQEAESHTHDILSEFAPDLFRLLKNLDQVLSLVKPAHTLLRYQSVFREVFRTIASDSMQLSLSSSYYEDARKNFYGIAQITGNAGIVGSDRSLFVDSTRDFANVRVGAGLTITGKTYQITDILHLPFPNDSTPRGYTTSPTGLAGSATVSESLISDSTQNFGLCVSGETITFLEGPNQGTYRLKYLFGSFGGVVGKSSGPASRVKPALCCLRVAPRILGSGSSISYHILLDPRGVKVPVLETEDISQLFA